MKRGVGQGETFLIRLMAAAFGLLRTMLNAINKTPVLREIFYILILQGVFQNSVSESDQRRLFLSFVLLVAVCE